MGKLHIALIFLILMNLSFISAIDYAPNPCNAPTVVYQNGTHYRMTGGCFEILFPKNASMPISFYDSYNNKTFDLKLYSIIDVNTANENQKRTHAFEDATTNVSSDGLKVYYTRDGGNISASYTIVGNQVKAGLIMDGWQSQYPVGRVELRTRIHKDPMASAHFVNLPAVVDGVEQPLNVQIEVAGQNQFFMQTLFVGNNFTTLEIDPIYTVDYSPTPASHLINGTVTASAESQFASIVDVTTGMSDNLTTTQYQTMQSATSIPTFTWYDEAPTNDTALVTTIDGSYSDTQLDYNAGKYGRLLLGSGTITNGTKVDFYYRPRDAVNIVVKLGDATNTYTYANFTTGIDTVNFHWENVTLSNVPANQTSIYVHEQNLGDNRRIYIDYIAVTLNDTSKGNALTGKWTVLYNSSYQYYLRLYKTTAGTDTVYVYAHNSTNTTSTTFTTGILAGTGWFNVNVTSLVQYMTTTLGLNFTGFRFFTANAHNFSEERLRAEINDSSAPVITNCSTNTTTLLCGQTARLQCDVTDALDVDTVAFQVNATNYSTTKAINVYHYDFSPIGMTPIGGIIYDWNNVYATDILGNGATLDPNISVNYSCCSPNWVENYGSCQTNDSQLKYYTDSNSCGSTFGLPVDNGTYVYCNYCSEDLQIHYLSDCNLSGQRSLEWDDHNYLSCCVITGLVSDCSILYSPYNETGYENCTATYHDFSLDLDLELFFGFGIGGLASDKVYGKIWLNDTTTNYTCLSYVKTTGGQIVQTNPPYTKRTDATIAITQKEIEDREFFRTENGLANIYWTNHNLVIDGRSYIFGVECAGNNSLLRSEKLSTVLYNPVNEPITRWFWAKENMVPIMLGTLMVIFVVIVIFLIWRIGR